MTTQNQQSETPNTDDHNLIKEELPIVDMDSAAPADEGLAAGEIVTESAPAEPAPAPKEDVEQVNLNAVCDYEVYAKRLDDKHAPLYTLRINSRELVNEYDKLPLNRLNQLESRDNLDPWENALLNAQGGVVTDGSYIDATIRTGSEWRQVVRSGEKVLGAMLVGNRAVEPGRELNEEQAIAKLHTQTGLGSIVKIPLWHTGLWVSLKAPADMRLNIFLELIAMEKIRLGRDSNGLSLAGTSVWLHEHLMELIQECLYHVNLKDFKADQFINLLSIHDLNSLYNGLACAIWPNGYSHSQACTAEPTQCHHVTEDHLNLSKLSWTDRNSLTDMQLKHMESHTVFKTVDEVLKYQEEFQYAKHANVNVVVDIFGKKTELKVKLRVPSVATYIHTCTKWVNECINSVQQAFGDRVSDKKRSEFIEQQSDISTLRQYAHFIDTITYPDGSYVKNSDAIANVLNILSGQPKTVTDLLTDIRTFIDNTVVSLIALPSYNCPGCKRPMTAKEKKHPYLIPLDAASTFFTLAARKL